MDTIGCQTKIDILEKKLSRNKELLKSIRDCSAQSLAELATLRHKIELAVEILSDNQTGQSLPDRVELAIKELTICPF